MKVLNLYAGLGGNRKLWNDVQVTAVESNEAIALVYAQNNPYDEVIVDDAHEYLLNHYQEYDFIWSSPPCQSHSRMIRSGKNRKPRYPDMRLYEEIVFLKHNFDGLWVVENVKPYYDPLIPYIAIGRHCFWTNFNFQPMTNEPTYKNFIMGTNTEASNSLKEWLGIHYDGNIYYDGNHCPAQVLRNCVHPDVGLHVFNEALKHVGITENQLNLL